MNPWCTDACWQNYSSLYREVAAAREAANEITRYHHLTSSLYFGISSLESFLNQRMRSYLAHKLDEEKIFKKLRTGQFLNKLKRWPVEILSAELAISDESMAKLELFYEVRGDLTHPKTGGHDIYSRLDTIDPEAVLIPVAEYIVRFYEAHLEVFPYWLFGWNYLNPRPDTHEIIVINNQQFSHSMNNLGFKVPAWDAGSADAWRKKNMTTFDGYLKIKDCLETVDGCEAKVERFPFQPKLCRRWWTEEHHRSCGHVTQSALERALELDR